MSESLRDGQARRHPQRALPESWKLRGALGLLNGIFTTLGLQKHPDKTFIRADRARFRLLGYRLWPDRITVAQATTVETPRSGHPA